MAAPQLASSSTQRLLRTDNIDATYRFTKREAHLVRMRDLAAFVAVISVLGVGAILAIEEWRVSAASVADAILDLGNRVLREASSRSPAELLSLFWQWCLVAWEKLQEWKGTLPVAMALGAYAWWSARRADRKWGDQWFAPRTALSEGTAEEKPARKLKEEYYRHADYGGRSDRALRAVAHAFSAPWEVHETLARTVTDERRRRPLHICVTAARARGRSTTLAHAAISWASDPANEVLWLLAPEKYVDLLVGNAHPFDWKKIERYATLRRGIARRLKTLFARKRLILIIDGIHQDEETEQARGIKSEFLTSFSRLQPWAPWKPRIFLITSSIGTALADSTPITVVATESDLTATLRKVKSEPSIISTSAESAQDIFRHHGGHSTGNIQDFLHLLAREGLDVGRSIAGEARNVLKYIAASQLLKGGERVPLPMPPELLSRVARSNGFDPNDVQGLRQDGIVTDKDFESPDGLTGYAFEAPQMAFAFLEDHNLVGELPEIFLDLARAIFAQHPLDPGELEYMRYLLQRLGRNRGPAYRGVDGPKIARNLIDECREPLTTALRVLADGPTICRWAGTLSSRELLPRAKALARELCARVAEHYPALPNQDGKTFVTYVKALRSVRDADLIKRSLPHLDAERVIWAARDHENPRRMNEILHAYCSLTWRLADFDNLSALLTRFGIPLDTASLFLKARLQWNWAFDRLPDNSENVTDYVEAALFAMRTSWEKYRPRRWMWASKRRKFQQLRARVVAEMRDFIWQIREWHLDFPPQRRARIIGTYLRWASQQPGSASREDVEKVCAAIERMAQGTGGRPIDAVFVEAVVNEVNRVESAMADLASQRISRLLQPVGSAKRVA